MRTSKRVPPPSIVLAIAAGFVLAAPDVLAQARAQCPSGAQPQWTAGAILRCQASKVVESLAATPCSNRDYAEGVMVDGVNGQFTVVAGGRDHCNFYLNRKKADGSRELKLHEQYATCPAGYTMAQDAGPGGRDLCVKTALVFVPPVIVPH